MRAYFLAMCSVIVMILAGCGENQTATKDLDYEQTKKMVVDILQTDEGKKALHDIISDDNMKQQLVMDSEVVKDSITEALVSEKGAEMWQKLFDDPEFVESFIKATEEEQKKLFKSLMYDADFQKKMIDLMQDPEMSEQTLSLLKSQQFRSHLEETIEETLSSPLYQAKMQETILKASEKNKDNENGEQNEDSNTDTNNDDNTDNNNQ